MCWFFGREGESTDESSGNSVFSGGKDRKVASCIERGGLGHETWIRVKKLERHVWQEQSCFL